MITLVSTLFMLLYTAIAFKEHRGQTVTNWFAILFVLISSIMLDCIDGLIALQFFK